MKKEKKNINLAQIAVFGVFVLIGGICGFLATYYLDSADGDTPINLLELLGLFVAIYAAVYLQVIIHEGGHLVFGLLSGYKFCSFRIGSIMLVKDANGKNRVRKLSLAGTGGQCLMAPPEMKNGSFPVMLYNLGGSLMNAVFSTVFLVLGLCFTFPSVIDLFFIAAALIGYCFALVNGIPMRMGSIDNDGYNALSLSKDPKALRALWLQLKINQQTSMGIRLKDMPKEWFALPKEEDMGNSMIAATAVFACNRLMDEKRFDEANNLMKDIMSKKNGVVALHRSLLICDRIFCELAVEQNAEAAKSLLTKEQLSFMKAMKSFPTVLRTQYVYSLLAEKDEKKTASIKKRFAAVAKSYPYPTDIASERELMEIAEAVCDN